MLNHSFDTKVKKDHNRGQRQGLANQTISLLILKICTDQVLKTKYLWIVARQYSF